MHERKLEEWAALQATLATQVIIPDSKSDLILNPGDAIFCLDVQYVGDTGFVAIDYAHWLGKR